MLRLNCKVQNYAWGKFGEDSIVGKIAKAESDSNNFNSTLPFAEYWIGDHVNGPSSVKIDQKNPILR